MIRDFGGVSGDQFIYFGKHVFGEFLLDALFVDEVSEDDAENAGDDDGDEDPDDFVALVDGDCVLVGTFGRGVCEVGAYGLKYSGRVLGAGVDLRIDSQFRSRNEP